MSATAFQWAFSQRLSTPQQQALLYVIADGADASGMARQCGADHLADCARLSRQTLLKCLAAMRDAGAIETADKFTEDGARVFDIRLLLEKQVALQRAEKLEDKPRPVATSYDLQSPEGRAIVLLHEISGLSQYLRSIMIRSGAVNYLQPVTPRMLAMIEAGKPDSWVVLSRQQAAAWEEFLRETVTVVMRKHLKEGDRAPWPWPPSAEGKIYATGPPEPALSDQDAADFG